MSFQRLGKNQGKYAGEGIDIERVVEEMEKAADDHGWKIEVFHKTAAWRLVAFTRRVPHSTRRVYVSTGIHGEENRWPSNTDIWLCPCLNPTGFPKNRRENDDGVDLNREYRNPKAEETRAHVAWLDKQPNFDITISLHEDWESEGFYVYELNPDDKPSFSKAIISRVAEVCPIDMSPEIEGRPASGGVIRPAMDPRGRPQWPESFYLLTKKTRLAYTTEAPSDFQLITRVAAEVASVRAVLDSLAST